MKKIQPEVIQNSMDYTDYRRLIDQLMLEGKTTGPQQSPALTEYTRMNVVRMKRLDKTTKLEAEVETALQGLARPIIALVLTEGWCGDAAQILPVVEQLATVSPKLEARYILRDEYLDIMDAFLTNGGRSIPKYIFLDAGTLDVLGTWGPRPDEVQQLVMDSKETMAAMPDPEARKAHFNEVKTELQRWYARDKTRSIQREFSAALLAAVGQELPVF